MTDANAIATQAVKDLQGSIDALNVQRSQPGADTQAIDTQIADLEGKQEQARELALEQIEEPQL